jgi:CRP-like cAMP-binding protein
MAAALVTAMGQSPSGPFALASNTAGRIDLISASPLFAGLSQIAYEEIARRARPRTFARDEVLFLQGQAVQSLALLRSGSVKITQLAPNGNEVILWMYGVGAAVGAISDPMSRQHTCTARAMEQSTALVWEYATLQGIIRENPQIGRNISMILAARLNELEERFREVATEKVAKRIALALLRLLKHIGKTVHGGVEVSLSREELAQMTGTTLFTASRVLSKWGQMGFVQPRRESVLVCDRNRLELVSEDV